MEGEKALYRLLGWRRGSFAFRERPVARERGAIERPTRALLREAQRQADEWERLGSELPPPHARVALKVARSSLPSVLHPLTQEVLLVLELSSRVSDVLDRCSFPDYQVLRTLQTLIRRGMVELRADSAAPEPPAGGLFGAGARRAAARLARPGPAARAGADRREGGAVRVGARGGAHVRGAARAPARRRADPGAATAPALRRSLRIPVDDEVAIEVFEVPAAPRFAPIWPLAAHGALAVLFVHGERDRGVGRRAARRGGSGGRDAARALLPRAARREEPARDRIAVREARPVRRPPRARDRRRSAGRGATALRELLTRLLP